ncbi:unnamed protein product, partial [Didymodactylos carnosus]
VFRTMMHSIINEIADIETRTNSIDAHIECQQSRMELDNHDLKLLLMKLKDEGVFSLGKNVVTELFTGKIIHNDIIDSICSGYNRGEEELKIFIQQRLIDKSVHIDSKMKRTKTLKLTDTDTYGITTQKTEKKTTKQLETKLRDLVVLSNHNHEINLIDYMKYEYTDTPPSLTDNMNLLNQQNK